jgi:hypothetical protein
MPWFDIRPVLDHRYRPASSTIVSTVHLVFRICEARVDLQLDPAIKSVQRVCRCVSSRFVIEYSSTL